MKPLIISSLQSHMAVARILGRDAGVDMAEMGAIPTSGASRVAQPTVIVLDRMFAQAAGAALADVLREWSAVAAIIGLGADGEAEPPADWPIESLSGFIARGAPPRAAAAQLRGAMLHAVALAGASDARRMEGERSAELTDLARVGAALSHERDLTKLLEMILTQARRVTTSDAGSIYLVERDADDAPVALRFKLAQNDSLAALPGSDFTVPIDHTSLAGHAATTREPLVLEDVYHLPAGTTFSFNKGFDQRFHYRTKSMLVIPLTTLRDDIVGVLQLINRKRHGDVRLTSQAVADEEVLPYDARAVELVGALASQAAVAIENSLLYEDIEKLFEGFVTAAVTAIESRDPTTSGHSGRVAVYSVGLAEAVDRGGSGRWKDLRFSREQLRELRYASLLHDFGKVGVREQVLVKAKKLYPPTLESIRDRVGYLRQGAELEFERDRSKYLTEHGKKGFAEHESALLARLATKLAELERFFSSVLKANEPSLLGDDAAMDLREFGARTFLGWDGSEHPLLDSDELRLLTIPKGTLDESERKEIESHVSHTFRFLREIPWTRELRRLPEIAYGHHEKLNGVGYPRGIAGEAIPVQTRIMTISDIYDALTASDRPYKAAVPSARAITILEAETKGGMLDADLVKVFVESKVWEPSKT